MPRPRLPYLHRTTTRHGRVVWYVRRRLGAPKIRLRSTPGTDEFLAEYQAALTGEALKKNGPSVGTLQWLVDRYYESTAWKNLAQSTRNQRHNIFQSTLKTAGQERASDITRGHIVAGRDRRSDTPSQAAHFIKAMRGLFRWAGEAGYVKLDPTAGVKNIHRKTDGFAAWTEEDIAAYEARWQMGTKERVWLDVLLYTGLRRGDAVRVGPAHVTNGVISIVTEKTGQVVAIPVLPILAATLTAGPIGRSTFIVGASGGSFNKWSFGTKFRLACRAAGVAKAAHGLRKAGATRAAENGATVAELEAVFGWSGGGMASHYTRAADRARLAKSAITKLNKTSPP